MEGTSNNKALEVWNVSGTNITFGSNAGQLSISIRIYANGAITPSATIPLTAGDKVAAGDVFVIAHSSAIFATNAHQTSSLATWNGDDAIVLMNGGQILDSIGQVGVDPGAEWGSGLTSTADNTLRRVPGNLAADMNPDDAYDPSVTFQGFPTDAFDDLGAPPSGALLGIHISSGNAVISWTALATGYQLQATTNLLGAGWSDLSGSPLVSNKRQWVTNSFLSHSRFYRLIK